MDIVEITLPVSRSTAERLSNPGARARLGALLNLAFKGAISPAVLAETIESAQATPERRRAAFRQALAEMRDAAANAGIMPDDVEEELAAWKVERASKRRRS